MRSRLLSVAFAAALLVPTTGGGAACAAPPSAARADAADQIVTGFISGADHQTYRSIWFDVPAGVERITVALQYDRSDRTVIDLGLWDPSRFRGWSGGTRDRFTISKSDASPGYLAGDLPRGRWQVMLGVPNARPKSRAAFKVTISFDRGRSLKASQAILDPPLKSGPGWYRGDLHMHDANSDGSCTSQSGRRVPCPLFRTVQAAAASKLDFIAVTDHNTVSHFGGLRELQPYFDRLLLVPGVEVTTFGGHSNIFGPRHFVDFRIGSKSVPDVRALEREIAASGAIMSVNHPALPSGEQCMGCGWTWKDTDWGKVTALEAVNGIYAEGPLAGIPFWYARLNEGHRLTGIGGSDNHDSDEPPGKPRIGRPTTVVYARELSTPGILDGIRAGNVFIDVDGSRDRLLEVSARAGGSSVAMGGRLRPQGVIDVEAHVVGVAGARAELILNGTLQAVAPVKTVDDRARFSLGGHECGWIAVNVVSAAGHHLLVGNPIYLACH